MPFSFNFCMQAAAVCPLTFAQSNNDLSVFFFIWQSMALMAVSGLALVVGIIALVLGAVRKCADLHSASTPRGRQCNVCKFLA